MALWRAKDISWHRPAVAARSIYVLDKEEALDFYVNKLGLEKGNDVQQGDYRWLTVRAPGDRLTEISLEQQGPPLHDEATAERLRELITKGGSTRRSAGKADGGQGRPGRRCHRVRPRTRSETSAALDSSRVVQLW